MVVFRNDFWLFVENSSKENLQNNYEKTFGKWLLFFNWDEAWEQWKKIVLAVENGNLNASSAKISRRLEYTDCETAFICVYTYENNIDLVRKQLFDLGFTNYLYYKTEEATEQDSYGHRSHLICENKIISTLHRETKSHI